MKKSTILLSALLLFSYCHAQYLENTFGVYEEVGTAESIITDLPTTEPVIHSFNLPKDGKINENLNGKLLYDAHVKNKRLHGGWQSWYENGLLCDSGSFVKGLPDGEWKHWDANGRLVALRTFSADKFQRINNELVRYNPRRIAFPLTVLYHKNKRAALKYLRASYSFASAARKKQGLSLPELITANVTPGNEYQPVFDLSLHHGLYINYFDNGIAKDSGYYHNGLRNGVWVHRDTPDGTFQIGSYENGVKVKGWRTYDMNGKLLSMIYYTNKGQVSWRKSFN